MLTKGKETAIIAVIYFGFWVACAFVGFPLLIRFRTTLGDLGDSTVESWFVCILLFGLYVVVGNAIWLGVMRLYSRHLQPKIVKPC